MGPDTVHVPLAMAEIGPRRPGRRRLAGWWSRPLSAMGRKTDLRERQPRHDFGRIRRRGVEYDGAARSARRGVSRELDPARVDRQTTRERVGGSERQSAVARLDDTRGTGNRGVDDLCVMHVEVAWLAPKFNPPRLTMPPLEVTFGVLPRGRSQP